MSDQSIPPHDPRRDPDLGPADQAPPSAGPPPRRLSAWAIAAGVVVGVVASWILIAVMMLTVLDSVGGSAGGLEWLVVTGTFLALPVLAGALMVSPRTRRWGAGLLMGVAIGSIVGAGACASLLGVGTL